MKKLIVFIILFGLPVYLSGQDTGVSEDLGPTVVGGTAKVAQSGAQFLQIGVSARATAMGEAFLSVTHDASATFYSPGSLSRLDRMSMMVTHTSLPANMKHFFGSFVLPLKGNIGTFGIHTILLTTGEMAVTRAFVGPTGESFSCSEMAVGLSYSRNLTDKFSVGGTVKYVQQDLSGFTARGWAADFGTYYLTGFRDMRFGMTIRNFGPDLNFGKRDDIGFESISYSMPMDFNFGISMSVIDLENSNLKVALQVNQPNDNLRREAVGFEYTLMNMLMLRGGYQFDLGDDDYGMGMSLGAGLKAAVSGFDGNFDVSWVQSEYLTDLIRFSFGVMF